MESQRIVRKHVKYLEGYNQFQVSMSYTNYEHAMSDYKRYSGMSDSVHKIEPEMLCEELNIFKAGIIIFVTALQYDIRNDRWNFNVLGYGVYNGELTTKEIVRNYYLHTEER